MALCTALSSSTFDVLICLGVPWFVKGMWFHKVNSSASVDIHSKSLDDSAIAVMVSTAGFMILMCAKKFALTKRVRTIFFTVVFTIGTIIIINDFISSFFFFEHIVWMVSCFHVVINLFSHGLQWVCNKMRTIRVV